MCPDKLSIVLEPEQFNLVLVCFSCFSPQLTLLERFMYRTGGGPGVDFLSLPGLEQLVQRFVPEGTTVSLKNIT